MTSPFVPAPAKLASLNELLEPSVTVSIPDFTQPNGMPQLAKRNNNPGNLKFAQQPDAVPGDKGFARFPTPEAGYHALLRQIRKSQSEGWPLGAFITKYAPPHENDTAAYVQHMSQQLGATPETTIDTLPTERIADVIAQRESGAKVQRIRTFAEFLASR